jgi:C1A family cysteine protease
MIYFHIEMIIKMKAFYLFIILAIACRVNSKAVYTSNPNHVNRVSSYSIVPHTHSSSNKLNNYTFPYSLNWRDKGVVNPSKNQETCGSCWAFSTTSVTESSYAIQHGILTQLSEQQLIDCDTDRQSGCSGGYIDLALEYLKNGACSQEYSYKNERSTCQTCSPTVKVSNIYYYNGYSEMMNGIQNGPITSAVDSTILNNYLYGVIDSSESGIKCNNQTDHDITIVGYNSNDGIDYWIVKNSWGTLWGNLGYFYIERGKNLICIEKYTSYGVDTQIYNENTTVINYNNRFTVFINFLRDSPSWLIAECVIFLLLILALTGYCIFLCITEKHCCCCK